MKGPPGSITFYHRALIFLWVVSSAYARQTITATVTAKTTVEGPTHPASALRLRRFKFTDDKYESPSGTFNPAALFHEGRGWVLVFRWDRCFYQQCGIHGTNTTPLVSLLGLDPTLPNISAAVTTAEPWSFDRPRFSEVLEENAATEASTGDYRPIVWKGEIYISFWIKFGWAVPRPPAQHKCWSDGWGTIHSCEYMALARMDFPSKTLHISHVFRLPVLGAMYRPEKNWAFYTVGPELFFYYKVSPCTTVFRFEEGSRTLATLEQAVCYHDAQQVYKETALHLGKARLSGNPILWNHNGTTDRLLMVHTRLQQSAYAHWIVCLDPATHHIKFISAGPVLKSSSYHLGGFFPGVVVVGSYHVIALDGKQVLRTFLGEGDQYSGYEDIPLDRVRWWTATPNRTFILHDEAEILQRQKRLHG